MTAITVREIVRGALKKLRVLPIGREPTAAQAQDALEIIQGMYREWIGQGVFGKMQDVLVTSATYSAREGERVVIDIESGCTVSLPETITESLTGAATYYDPSASDYGRAVGCEALPRPPRDGACIIVADVNSSSERYYLYDANRAYWVIVDDLTLDSTAPLSKRYENGLKAMLAIRLADSYGREPSATMQGEANTFRYALSAKPDRIRSPVAVQYF